MKTYEETIKYLAELYRAAAGDKLYQPSDKPQSPYAPGNFFSRGEQHKNKHYDYWIDFKEYDKALHEAERELDTSWFKLNKDTLDYIHGRLMF